MFFFIFQSTALHPHSLSRLSHTHSSNTPSHANHHTSEHLVLYRTMLASDPAQFRGVTACSLVVRKVKLFLFIALVTSFGRAYNTVRPTLLGLQCALGCAHRVGLTLCVALGGSTTRLFAPILLRLRCPKFFKHQTLKALDADIATDASSTQGQAE